MLDEFEKGIARVLDHVIIEDKQVSGIGNAESTRRIKQRLCSVGHQKGFSVSADRCEGADTGAWLFDLVWAEQQNNPERFIGIPLVMQFEWDPSLDVILREFEKLLVAKAPHKVMVFQQAVRDNVTNVMTILADRVRYFQLTLPNERYLLAGYAYDQRVYKYETV